MLPSATLTFLPSSSISIMSLLGSADQTYWGTMQVLWSTW